MVVEKLKMEDLDQVVALHASLIPFDIAFESAEEEYQKMLEDDAYLLAAVKEGDEVLGVATGTCCRTLSVPFLVIEDVVVKEGMRGRGIGHLLMEEMDRFAAEKNCMYSILISSGFRQDAHRFYENCGFVDSVRGFRKVYRAFKE